MFFPTFSFLFPNNDSLKPNILFIGVLISCDIEDKNSVCALLAFSASFLDISNSLINLLSWLSLVKNIKHTTVAK